MSVQVLIVLDSDPRSANAGVWCTMFFIYMTYTLLALHVEECTVSGLLLGFTQVWCPRRYRTDYFVLFPQVACAAGLNYTDNFLIKQVRSTNKLVRLHLKVNRTRVK